MEITGRLTRDAVVAKTAKDRQVVTSLLQLMTYTKPKTVMR